MTSFAFRFGLNVKARKTWLFAAIAAAIALFSMLMFYLYLAPKSDVALKFEAAGYSNEASKGTEFRINYIMVDDVYLPLKEYSTNGFLYDGTLYTSGPGIKNLAFTVKANRYIEVSLKKGQWMSQGQIWVGDEYQSVDFYSEADSTQHVIFERVHHFARPISLVLGVVVFLLFFAAATLCSRKHKSDYWDSNIQLKEVIVCCVILILTILLGWDHSFVPRMKNGLMWPDSAIFIANTTSLLAGKAPYVDWHDEKGAMLNIILTIGQCIWFPHGIWILEMVLFLVALIFLYFALRKEYPRFISLSAVFVSAVITSRFTGGVGTELVSLPFICVAFYVFACIQSSDRLNKRWLFVCGAFFSIVIFTRINNGALWVPYVIAMFLTLLNKKKRKLTWHSILYLGIGALTIMLLFFGWLFIHGGIVGYYKSAILYAKYYMSNTPLLTIIKTGLDMLVETEVRHILYLPVFVLVLDVYSVVRKQFNTTIYRAVLRWILAIFCFLIACMTGRKYPHYLLILFPLFADFAAALFNYCSSIVLSFRNKYNELIFVLTVSLAIVSYGKLPLIEMCNKVILGYASSQNTAYVPIPDGEIKFVQVANFIESNTVPGEVFSVYDRLSYGSMIQNFLKDRYVDGFVFVSYNDEIYENLQADDYMSAIRHNNKFFINTVNAPLPPDVMDYVTEHYVRIESFDQVGVYEYIGK